LPQANQVTAVDAPSTPPTPTCGHVWKPRATRSHVCSRARATHGGLRVSRPRRGAGRERKGSRANEAVLPRRPRPMQAPNLLNPAPRVPLPRCAPTHQEQASSHRCSCQRRRPARQRCLADERHGRIHRQEVETCSIRPAGRGSLLAARPQRADRGEAHSSPPPAGRFASCSCVLQHGSASLLAWLLGMPGSRLRAAGGRCSLMACFSSCSGGGWPQRQEGGAVHRQRTSRF
jgi:hypothetical protein